MATCSFKTKLALSLTAAFSFFAMVFSLGGITLAAYLNAIEAEYSNRIDFSDLSEYFNSITKDADTGKTIYQISSEDQLRNLQMLVSLGLFDEDDVFNLTIDINWSGAPMAPIGSDDMPFNSTFNGCGHTITNLQIACSDGRDAGLFGYTSITSEVKNLVLITPTIAVYDNSDGGTEVSGSPVEAALIAAAKGMPDIAFSENGQEVAGSITVINNSDTSQSTINGFPQTVQDINGNSYEVIYESSDENLIKAQGDGSFLTYKTDTAAPNFDLFAGTITAKVGYLIDDRFGYYVLERYQFNVLGNGLVSTATTEVGEGDTAIKYRSGAFKTIHSSIQEHSTYTGFFIGHCDGKANHLGMDGGTGAGSSNGKIVIDDGSRVSVYSARTLIGMTRKDNPIDASAGDTMSVTYDFDGSINGNHNFATDGENMKVVDYQYGYESLGNGYGYGSNDSDTYNNNYDTDSENQKANARTISSKLIPNSSMEYSMFYPGTNQTIANQETGRMKSASSNWTRVEYSDNADTPEENDGGYFNSQVIDGGVGAGTWAKVSREYGRFIIFPITYHFRLGRGINVNNGFWMWATKNLSPIFGQNLFYINFKISYVATTTSSVNNQNSFQILMNAYNPDVKGNSTIISDWNSSHTQYLFWQDMSEPYGIDSELATNSFNEYYDPSEHPVIDDGKLHSDVVTLEVDQQNGTFWSNLLQGLQNWWTGSDDEHEVRYPTFAFGMGSNVDEDGNKYEIVEGVTSRHRSTMRYYADVINGASASTNGHFIDWKIHKFNESESTNGNWIGNYLFSPNGLEGTFVANGYQTFDPTGNKTTDIESSYYNSKERTYFNSYFEVAGDTKLYVKDFQITFTNRIGNTEDIIYSVDYVNNGNIVWNEDTMSYDSWPTDSNVMIGFDMSQTAGGVTYSFYRNGNTVYGNSTNTTAYPLQNVGGTGYTDAVLGQG